ncbi:CGNR zinc finger domain-containing protein [Dactylosporangium sp. NPDC000521]|uniref:CGNR zinc finger domain-containing protein n=1 Tax=Dactylosporangium sp. NPDC000521 TaxID=3363975 RepID=UPI0036D10E9E
MHEPPPSVGVGYLVPAAGVGRTRVQPPSSLEPVASVTRSRGTTPERDRAAGRSGRCESPACCLFFVQHHPRRRYCHESCAHRDRQARYYRRRSPA